MSFTPLHCRGTAVRPPRRDPLELGQFALLSHDVHLLRLTGPAAGSTRAARVPRPRNAAPMTRRARSPNFDDAAFRRALGQFATGVTIITTRTTDGHPIGFTASSFNSVSLDPPLVLWSLAKRSASMPVFRANSHYVVNVLAASQLDLCRRFASVKGDRFEGVSHEAGDTGMPVLEGALAWFECHNRSRYDEGDHVIFVGEVERCGVRGDAAEVGPLVFQSGLFHRLQQL